MAVNAPAFKVNAKNVAALRKAYATAPRTKDDTFTVEIVGETYEFVSPYAKYLLEYVESILAGKTGVYDAEKSKKEKEKKKEK